MLPFREIAMPRITEFRSLLAALVFGACSMAGAETRPAGDSDIHAKINSSARLMAGVQGSDSRFARTGAWKEHSQFMRASWERLNGRQVAAMNAWRDEQLGRACPAGRTLMYPFSGPDFLNAHWLFPGCDTIVMFGLEHIGEVPDVDTLNERALVQLTADVRKAMANFIDRNYFITDSMAKQLRTSHLQGVVPIFMLSMALSGMDILSVAPLELAPMSRGVTPAEGQPMRQLKGVTIEFLAPGATSPQRLNYFSVDAADKGLAHYPEFLAYVRKLAPTTTFIKSASYLLQGSEFREMRSALLEISSFVVQDDSGLPYALLQNQGWKVHLHGRYDRPIPPFGGSFQVALNRAYKAQDPAPLPFTFGYQYHDFRDSRSNLIVAQRQGTGAQKRSQ